MRPGSVNAGRCGCALVQGLFSTPVDVAAESLLKTLWRPWKTPVALYLILISKPSCLALNFPLSLFAITAFYRLLTSRPDTPLLFWPI